MDVSKTVLLTGAFGNLGCYILKELLAQGFSVKAFDLANKENQKQAQAFNGNAKLSVNWGDIRDESLINSLVKGVDAVIHLACILPPVTEDAPELTQAVNVEATRQLIKACEAQIDSPQFLYASSFTVFGLRQDQSQEQSVYDRVEATDNYTRQKLECEAALDASKLNYMVGRIGVSIDEALRIADKRLVQSMMSVHSANPMEYIHPSDVARAFVNAIDNEQARRKIFLLGGGKSCQVTQLDLVQGLLGAAGMPFKAQDLGDKIYYTHWLDTHEAQAVLNFQRYSFEQYKQDVQTKLKWVRLLVAPIGVLVKRLFLLWLKF